MAYGISQKEIDPFYIEAERHLFPVRLKLFSILCKSNLFILLASTQLQHR